MHDSKRTNTCVAFLDPNSESRDQRAARLQKEAASGNENRVADVKNGVNGTNGHANGNGNGAVAENEVPVSNGNGFRYNEYDGKQ